MVGVFMNIVDKDIFDRQHCRESQPVTIGEYVLRLCPNCNDVLNNQYIYSNMSVYHVCLNCGAALKRSTYFDDFELVDKDIEEDY